MRDPVVLPKAIKNPVEIAGQKAAQARDGAAISRFLKWIDEEAPKGGVDELAASDHLEALRRDPGANHDAALSRLATALAEVEAAIATMTVDQAAIAAESVAAASGEGGASLTTLIAELDDLLRRRSLRAAGCFDRRGVFPEHLRFVAAVLPPNLISVHCRLRADQNRGKSLGRPQAAFMGV